MSNINIWDYYIKDNIISSKQYLKVYKAINKKTGEYVVIKEIDKSKYNQLFQYSFKIEEFTIKLKNINIIQNIINTKDFFYIIMDVCLCNLEQYLQSKKEEFSFKQIQNFLKQLNIYFKTMKEENIINLNLKPSKILVSLNNNNEIIYSLIDYGINNIENNKMKTHSSVNRMSFTLPPEILKGEKISNNSDIWSLGIIIYYICFKRYPFTGNNEYKILQNIEINQYNKINDEDLNDLVSKMLKVDIKQRISWENYFNHPFFSKNYSNENNDFNLLCKKHSININSYCKDCKCNICDSCFIQNHKKHQIISFHDIGFNESELEQINEVLKDIDNSFIQFNENKKKIEKFLNKVSQIKSNKNIYDKDIKNNYKQNYINYMKKLNEEIKKRNEINLMELLDNYITCEYLIEDDLNERILNSFDETQKEEWSFPGISNEKELKDNYELYINYKKINFCYKYNFPEKGNYILKIKCLNPFLNMSFIFYHCTSLINVNFSYFNSKNVDNLSHIFDGCSSLISLDLSNFNSNNIIDMSYMFSYCSSLVNLNLSNFNTNSAINLSFMFYNCSSLNNLDLSSFNTNNAIDMSAMFYNCSSLNSISLSNFNTEKVTNMSFMFSGCSSLSNLNLSNFNFNKVNNLNNMFSNCTSLLDLNISNLVVNKSCDIKGIFNRLNEKCKIITNDKTILKILNK